MSENNDDRISTSDDDIENTPIDMIVELCEGFLAIFYSVVDVLKETKLGQTVQKLIGSTREKILKAIREKQ